MRNHLLLGPLAGQPASQTDRKPRARQGRATLCANYDPLESICNLFSTRLSLAHLKSQAGREAIFGRQKLRVEIRSAGRPSITISAAESKIQSDRFETIGAAQVGAQQVARARQLNLCDCFARLARLSSHVASSCFARIFKLKSVPSERAKARRILHFAARLIRLLPRAAKRSQGQPADSLAPRRSGGP